MMKRKKVSIFWAPLLEVRTRSVQISRHCNCFKRVSAVSPDSALRSLSRALQMYDTLSSGLLCSNSCLHRQATNVLQHYMFHPSQTTFGWPMPSQIDCEHGSRVPLRIPVLSRDVSSPSLRKFQLSERKFLLRQNSSSLTAVFLTKQKESCFPTA